MEKVRLGPANTKVAKSSPPGSEKAGATPAEKPALTFGAVWSSSSGAGLGLCSAAQSGRTHSKSAAQRARAVRRRMVSPLLDRSEDGRTFCAGACTGGRSRTALAFGGTGERTRRKQPFLKIEAQKPWISRLQLNAFSLTELTATNLSSGSPGKRQGVAEIRRLRLSSRSPK